MLCSASYQTARAIGRFGQVVQSSFQFIDCELICFHTAGSLKIILGSSRNFGNDRNASV
jgi:hypothetical protein